MEVVTSHKDGRSLGSLLDEFVPGPVTLRAVVAYFTAAEFIEKIADVRDAEVHLVVALSPPTSYYALKTIYWRENVHISFIHSGLHTKLYIVESATRTIAIVGSSNLTSGGLQTNLETNVVFEGDEINQVGVSRHFTDLANLAEVLTPDVLHDYKAVYDAFVRSNPHAPTPWVRTRKSLSTSAARSFVSFWTCVDHVRDAVSDVLESRFREVPQYIAVDHFWHWIVSIERMEDAGDRTVPCEPTQLRELFARYADWFESVGGLDEELRRRIETVESLLSESNISTLTVEDVRRVYACLHSTAMRSQRFHADDKFIGENALEDIIRTFRALLHSELRVEHRIDEALTVHKLRHFGDSNVQELNGWFRPERFPIRNAKADKALAVLGLKRFA